MDVTSKVDMSSPPKAHIDSLAIGTSMLELLKDDAGLSVAAIVVPEDAMPAAREALARLAPGAAVVSSVPQAGIGLVA